MKVVAYGREERQRGLAAAVAGLRAIGADVEVIDGKGAEDFYAPDCDFAIMEGVRGHHRYFWNAHKRDGVPILLVEYGYLKRSTSPLDDQEFTWQIGLNKLGWVPEYECPSDRFDALGISMKPWRAPDDDQPIVVCGDHPGYLDESGDFIWPEIRHWAVTALEKLRQATDRRILFRPHPAQQIFIHGYNGLSRGPIDWHSQWACVVHKSNSGNEALFAGCPVFTDGDADYRELSSSDLSQVESPYLPEREAYFRRLAYAQWTLEEIRTGSPFRHYLENGVI